MQFSYLSVVSFKGFAHHFQGTPTDDSIVLKLYKHSMEPNVRKQKEKSFTTCEILQSSSLAGIK